MPYSRLSHAPRGAVGTPASHFSWVSIENVIAPQRQDAEDRRPCRSAAGHAPCPADGVVLNAITRAALIVLPLTVVAARLHARVVQPPISTTQEVNRCLMLVRTASSRRGQVKPGTRPVATVKIDARPEYLQIPTPTAA
jgi:hypothetical protein